MTDFNKQMVVSSDLVAIKEEDESVSTETDVLTLQESENFNFMSVVKEEFDYRLEKSQENASYFLGSESQSVELPEELVDRVFAECVNDTKKKWEEFFLRFKMQNGYPAILSATSAMSNMEMETKEPSIAIESVGYHSQYSSEHPKGHEHGDNSIVKFQKNVKIGAMDVKVKEEEDYIVETYRRDEEGNKCHSLATSGNIVNRALTQNVVYEEELDAFFSKFNMEASSKGIDWELEEDTKKNIYSIGDKCYPLEIPKDLVDRVFAQNVGDDEEEWEAFYSKFNMRNRENLAILPSVGTLVGTSDISTNKDLICHHPQSFSKHLGDINHSKGKCKNCMKSRTYRSVDIRSATNKFRRGIVKSPLSSYTLFDGSVIKLKPLSVLLKDLFPKNCASSSKDKKTKFNRSYSFKTVRTRKKKDPRTEKGSRNKRSTAGNKCYPQEISMELSRNFFAQNAPDEEELDAFFSKFNMQEDEIPENLALASCAVDAETECPNTCRKPVFCNSQPSSKHQKDCDHHFKNGGICIQNSSCSTVDIKNSVNKYNRNFVNNPQMFSSKTFYDKNIKLKNLSVILEDLFPKNSNTSAPTDKGIKLNISHDSKMVIMNENHFIVDKDGGNEGDFSSNSCNSLKVREDIDRVFAQNVISEEELDTFFSKFKMQDSENLAIFPSTSSNTATDIKTKDPSITGGLADHQPKFLWKPKRRWTDLLNFQQEKTVRISRDDNFAKNRPYSSIDVQSSFKKFGRVLNDAPASLSDLFHDANAMKLMDVSVVLEDLFPKNPMNSLLKDKNEKFDSLSSFEMAAIKKEEDFTSTEARGNTVNLLGKEGNVKIPEDFTSRVISEQELDAFFSKFTMQDCTNFTIASPVPPLLDLRKETEEPNFPKESVNHNPQYLSGQSDESGHVDKSQIKSVKCEKTDCEISKNRKHLENSFSDAVDIKIPIFESSGEFTNAQQLSLNPFQRTTDIEHMFAFIKPEDLFSKSQSDLEPCS